MSGDSDDRISYESVYDGGLQVLTEILPTDYAFESARVRHLDTGLQQNRTSRHRAATLTLPRRHLPECRIPPAHTFLARRPRLPTLLQTEPGPGTSVLSRSRRLTRRVPFDVSRHETVMIWSTVGEADRLRFRSSQVWLGRTRLMLQRSTRANGFLQPRSVT